MVEARRTNALQLFIHLFILRANSLYFYNLLRILLLLIFIAVLIFHICHAYWLELRGNQEQNQQHHLVVHDQLSISSSISSSILGQPSTTIVVTTKYLCILRVDGGPSRFLSGEKCIKNILLSFQQQQRRHRYCDPVVVVIIRDGCCWPGGYSVYCLDLTWLALSFLLPISTVALSLSLFLSIWSPIWTIILTIPLII